MLEEIGKETSMRRIEKLMQGWSFTGHNGNRQAVSLPHTWNGKDGQDGGNDYYRIKCVFLHEYR